MKRARRPDNGLVGAHIRAWVAAAVVVAACSAGASPEGRPRADVAPQPALTRAIVERTNAERVRARLSPLREEAKLSRAARLHAEQMARVGRLAHELAGAKHPTLTDRLDEVDYDWQAAGENVAVGQPDAATVVGDWMRSRGHRANILNRAFTEFGVGHAERAGRRYYVQVFAAPR